jgi:hypothetical protein
VIDPEVAVAIKTIENTLPKVRRTTPSVAWHLEHDLTTLKKILEKE